MKKTHAVWLKREGKGETFERTMRIDLDEAPGDHYATGTLTIMGAHMWVEAVEVKAERDEDGADVAVNPTYQDRIDSVCAEYEYGATQRAKFDQREWFIVVVPFGA